MVLGLVFGLVWFGFGFGFEFGVLVWCFGVFDVFLCTTIFRQGARCDWCFVGVRLFAVVVCPALCFFEHILGGANQSEARLFSMLQQCMLHDAV